MDSSRREFWGFTPASLLASGGLFLTSIPLYFNLGLILQNIVGGIAVAMIIKSIMVNRKKGFDDKWRRVNYELHIGMFVVAIVLAGTGAALNLKGVFSIIGASFGPICGSMVADYLLSGCKWAGPRKGINWAGYIAWAVGFVVAILPMLSAEKFGFINPAPVIAFVIGFVLYAVLAKMGFEPPTVGIVQAQSPRPSAPVSAAAQ